MAPRGRQTIAASVIGYALLRTDIEVADAPLDMTIRLSEGAGAYTERVTVSGSLRRESDSVLAGTSLYGRELETLRGAVLDDPLRAMQSLPSATATDDFYSEFAVRGNPFRYVGLVVDGVPTRYLMHAVNGITDGGSIAMINSETLGSVSLLPGSYPQRTGRQMGAEVDLATREGSRDEFRGRAGLSGTSATFLGEGPIAGGKGSWLASVRRSYLDYLIKRIDPDAGFAFGFVDAQAKAVYDVSPRHQVSISALLGRAVFEEGDPDIGVNEIRTGISRAWLSSLSWRYLPSPRLAVTQRLYSTGLRFRQRQSRRRHARHRAVHQARVARRRLVRADDARGRRVRRRRRAPRRPQRHRPADLARRRGGEVTLNTYDEHAAAGSAYGQVRIGLGSRLTVTPGGRVDHWTLTGSTTASPWVNAEFRLSERTRLRGGTGIYRQFPDLDEVLRHSRRRRRAAAGTRAARRCRHRADAASPDAHPLQCLHARRSGTCCGRRVPSRSSFSNGALLPGAFNAPWVNALSGDARGAEVVVRRDAADGFSGWAGYAFSRLRYTDTQTGEQLLGQMPTSGTRSRCTGTIASRAGRASAHGTDTARTTRCVDTSGSRRRPWANNPLVDGRPLFYGLSIGAQHAAAAGLLTPGRPRRSRVHTGRAAGSSSSWMSRTS